MKILVTGGTGFIGQHLVKALVKKGHQVKVIARDDQKASLIKKLGAQVILGDLGNWRFLEKELAGIEVVYHLAAIPGQFWGIAEKEYQKVNLGFTQNLLRASLAHKLKRFIFCSSARAVDPSFYGQSKFRAEKRVARSRLDYVLVRPCLVYGPGDQKAILRICRLVKKGFFPLIDGGKAKLTVIYIDDLTALFLKCLSPQAKNRLFWAVGEEIAVRDLVAMIARKLNRSCWRFSFPSQLMKVVAVPLEMISLVTKSPPILTREQVDFATTTTDWQIEAVKKEKDFWQPKVKFAQGIEKTIAWYQENHWL